MSPTSPTDGAVVKLTSTARKLHTSHIPFIREVDDLHALQVCCICVSLETNIPQDKTNYALFASLDEKEEFCRPKRPLLESRNKRARNLSSKLSQFCTTSIEVIVDKRMKFERPNSNITSNSVSAQSIAERKLDLTDDDVEFLISYNQLLRKDEDNNASVLFTDEDFIKAFYKWDVESIRSSIGKGIAPKRIDIASAFSCLKSSGVKKEIPVDLFKPLYDYYCRRWEGHENLPVCRCSWVIIQQLNEEQRNLVAKLA